MNGLELGYSKPLDASWAASGIALPFLFVPGDVALAGTPTTLVNKGNAGPAALALTDTGGTYDDTEGFLSGSTGLQIHPNNATYDAPADPLYDLGDIFKNYNPASSSGGGILLAIFDFFSTGVPALGTIFGFGRNDANAASRGWLLMHSTGANADLGMGGYYDSTAPYTGAVPTEITTSAGGLFPADGATRKVALLFNAAQKNLRMSINNVEQVLSVSTLLSTWKTAPNNNGLTIGSRNSIATPGSRSGAGNPLAATAHVRNLLLMNLTALGSSDAENEFTAMADAQYRAPNYGLSRYFEKF